MNLATHRRILQPSAVQGLPAGFRWGVATSSYQIEGPQPRTAARRPSGTPSAGCPARCTRRSTVMWPATTTTGCPRTWS
ncbi:hypothetical protein NKH18_36245 [Streptomyces sp. M10(2022)]